MSEKFQPKNKGVLTSASWQKLKAITPRDIKKAIAMSIGAITRFDLTGRK